MEGGGGRERDRERERGRGREREIDRERERNEGALPRHYQGVCHTDTISLLPPLYLLDHALLWCYR